MLPATGPSSDPVGLSPELASAPLLRLDLHGHIHSANARACALFGATRRDLMADGLQRFLRTEDFDLVRFLGACVRASHWRPAACDMHLGEAAPLRMRLEGARACARSVWLRIKPHEHRSASGIFLQLNERLDQLGQELRTQREARDVLGSEKRVLQTIAKGAPLASALAELVSIVQHHCGSHAASVLRLDSRTGTLHESVNINLSAPYSDAIEGLKIGPTMGSCGTAAHSREPVISSDIRTDARWEGFHELAAEEGVLSCWSAPILSSEGHVLGTFALYDTIVREPTSAELEIVTHAADIASIAITRHHHMRERQRLLKEARAGRRAAEATNRTKDQFIAMLGHELRNPLSAIVLAAEVLDGKDTSAEKTAHLHRVVLRQGKHLARILEDLLDVARLDSGKFTLQTEPLDLERLVAECLDDLAVRAESKNISSTFQGETVWVDADPVRLLQIVRNVVENAIKYGREGGTIKTSLTKLDGMAVLAIADDGVGFDPEFLAIAFEPFAQAPQPVVRSDGGVGLGLPVVRRLVELHGGTITIDSPGRQQGSTVTIQFPAIEVLPPKPAPTGRSPTAPGSDLDGLRVVLVEDHADVREGLRQILQRWGCTVACYDDGQQALTATLAHLPDVALIDIGLPTLDGHQVARALRTAVPEKDLYLLALTGYGQASDRKRALEAGFDDHLVKPVDLPALYALLTKRQAGARL